jgi:hypothetical protein
LRTKDMRPYSRKSGVLPARGFCLGIHRDWLEVL